jgi:hypothetical protein
VSIAGLVALTTVAGASVVSAVPLATPAISTTPGQTAVTLSGSTPPKLTDSAMLSAGTHPSGTITFTLVYNATTVDNETAMVHGNGTYTTPTGYTLPTNVTVAGTYQWNASYSGDSANNPVSDTNNAGERVVISVATPSISTAVGQTDVTLSGPTPPTLTDSAMLSGGYHPSGSITFTLVYNSSIVDTESVTVHGNGTYTTPGYMPPTDQSTVTGTYQWSASYSGDGNNAIATDTSSTNEQEVVAIASPSISTTPDPTSVTLSGPTPPTLTDSADLSGGFHPAGTITFTLTYNSAVVDTEMATVHGNATYTTPAGYQPPTDQSTVTGTYQWAASYSGDPNNAGASDTDTTDEQAEIDSAVPTITTTPSTTSAVLSTTPLTLTDSAVLAGGFHPAGTITFTLFDGAVLVDTETVNVHGNATYTTPTGYAVATAAASAGTYQWDASYSGDLNNMSASETNSPTEQTVVSTGCAAGQTFHLLTATATDPALSFTGIFCVNAAGTGTYTQSGGAHGTGQILTSGSTTWFSASGTGLALLGERTTAFTNFTETAPLPMKTGTFTLQ